ncbi:hypothetical protein PCA01_04580 [Pseudoalteromonas carrageenovora]|nr:hypothetical protein PCA01_04580 [Pseudoalteromonas carrageenovora]
MLSTSPFIKQKIKKFYSNIQFYINKKKYNVKTVDPVSIINSEGAETFFGYYDKTPDNGLGLVLVYSTKESTKLKPKEVEEIFLDVYSLENKEYILPEKINVKAFNWQQGSRAHWLDSDHFIFNDYCSSADDYHSYIYSLSAGRIVKELSHPVQDSFKSDYILSISYKTLAVLRPDYGYFRHSSSKETNLEDNDGIWKLDLESNKSELLLTIKDICSMDFLGDYQDYKHKINHVMISPDGSQFIFMHRYFNANGKRVDRLFLSDSRGKSIRLISNFGMVSHCYWYDSDNILAYLRSKEGKDAYWKIDINTLTFVELNDGVFSPFGDGHPSVSNKMIITDTYPNKSRMQLLLLTFKGVNSYTKLGEFYHSSDFSGETRCDLHPRFSSCGNLIFFDTVYSGSRRLCYLDISRELTKYES